MKNSNNKILLIDNEPDIGLAFKIGLDVPEIAIAFLANNNLCELLYILCSLKNRIHTL
jgi:hypothetical protein